MALAIACLDTPVLIVQLELPSVQWIARVTASAILTPNVDVILDGLVRAAT
jgi:hypothetical protein